MMKKEGWREWCDDDDEIREWMTVDGSEEMMRCGKGKR